MVCSPVARHWVSCISSGVFLRLADDWFSFAGDKEISILSGKCLRPNPHNRRILVLCQAAT